jgi:dTDP-4-amino-4,6-dideoxygalactose transaminase
MPKPVYLGSKAKNYHIYNQFTIRLANRDLIKDFLAKNDIGADIYYPVPFHRQECFQHLSAADSDYYIANRLASEVLSIPIYPELTEEQIEFTSSKLYEAISSIE